MGFCEVKEKHVDHLNLDYFILNISVYSVGTLVDLFRQHVTVYKL